MADEQGVPGSSEFGRRLAALKGEGATFLVVGAVPREVRARACRNVLGAAGERRRRLIALVGADPGRVEDLLSPDHPRDAGYLRVVHHRTDERSTGSVTDGGPRGPSPTGRSRVTGPDNGDGTGAGDGRGEGVDHRVDGGLPELGTAIVESIDAFEAISGGLDPAELRICVDSLSPLVAEHGQSAVFRFLHLLTERARRSGALAFFYMGTAPDDQATIMLSSLFDGLVELRVQDGRAEQRWDLDEAGASEWIPVDDCPES